MAGVCQAEVETEVKCNPHKFYETMKYSLHHSLPFSLKDLLMHKYLKEMERVRAPLGFGNIFFQDDKNMIIVLSVEEGDIHNHYKHFTVTISVKPKGEGSLVKWAVVSEKHNDEVPDPHHYLEFYCKLNEKVDAYVHKA
ncbi:hypothetical protein IFM89_011610 [Coptis chinensis]|uniref:Bet v I/Major latex protein domain-containing protein n=1 Tax=Coptis chinensis TaxID=261450 RepID=A0A835LGW1_9MAGN|nr:hypothetical protein IFM89_011610 [Coptis chinensis]